MKFISKNTLHFCLLACTIYFSGCDRGSQQPNYEQTLIKAQSYLSSGQIESAVLESQNLIQINPNAPESFILLGDTFKTVGDYKNAAQSYQKAITIGLQQPQLLNIRYKHIDALIKLGRLEEAEEAISIVKTYNIKKDAKILQLKADIALTRGLYDEANLTYMRALKLEPQQSESLLGLAIAAQAIGNTETATDWLNQALESQTDFIEAYIFQGFFYLSQKQPDRAEASFSTALAALRKYDLMTSQKYQTIQGLAKSFVDQGRTDEALQLNKTLADSPQGKVQQGVKNALQAYEQGDMTEAGKNFEQVLSMAPEHQFSKLGLGMLKLQEGEIETAEHLLNQATHDLDTLNEKAFKAIALARLRLGKTEAALDIIKSGLKRFPLSTDLHLLQATTLAANKHFDSASSILQNMLSKDPNNPDTLNLMAHIHQQEDRIQQARELYLKSIRIKPELFPAYRGLFSSYINEPQEAQKQIEQILSEQASPVLMTEIALGITYLLNNDDVNARNLGRALLKKAPDNPQVKRLLGSALHSTALADYKKQRIQPAYIQLKEAIAVSPTENSVTLLTRLAVELQRPDEAVQIIQKLIQDQPGFALGFELLGDLSMASSDNKTAIKYFEDAWSINPTFRLAIKLFKLKKENATLSDSLAHIEKWHTTTELALESNPDNQQLQHTLESTLFALATANEQHQQNQKAIDYYSSLLKLKPESPLYLNNIAWLMFVENQDDAVIFAEKAFSLAPEKGEIIDTYAWILVQQGETKKGIKLLKIAAEKSPNNSMIKQHLDQATQMQSKSI